jgi:siroheme synthase
MPTIGASHGHPGRRRAWLRRPAAARSGGTLAIYTGLITLPRLRDDLLGHGIAPDLPR